VRWDEIRHFAHPELAVVEWLTTGTPRGSTRYEVQGCDILALRDGRIAAKRSYRKGTI
jgi:ketosteroid isomerase-like protein